MCGIVGFLEATPRRARSDTQRLVGAMTRTLAHRGPDDEGVFVSASGACALGHRRLSVQDLSPAGHQPMQAAAGRFTLVYNGELYNADDLRASLDVSWRGHSDTEVLLAALIAWGPERTLKRANGMFAFALYDAERERLLLARDRFGKKPLYLLRTASGDVAFASELRAFHSYPGFIPDVDRLALAAYFEHGAVPGERAIFRGTEKVAPGTYRVLERHPDRVREVERGAYFTVLDLLERDAGTEPPSTLDEAVDALETTLGDAIERRLVSDVPVGAFLSGGVDSATVVALMKDRANGAVQTFTIGLPGTEHDEADRASAIAAALGVEHHTLPVGPDDVLSLATEIGALYDEPFADPSAVPTTWLCRKTREHVTVALSGDGADELLGGYRRYAWAREVWARAKQVPAPMRKIPAGVLALLPTGALHRTASVLKKGTSTLGIPSHLSRYVDEDGLRDLAGFVAADDRAALYHRFRSVWPADEHPVLGTPPPPRDTGFLELSWPEGMLLDDVVGYLPDDILVKVDRASMSVGLEVRSPFLDVEVARLGLQLPLAWRLPDEGATHGGENKVVLRKLLGRFLSPALVAEEKRGFTLPIDVWLRGPLRDFGASLIDDSRLAKEGLLDGDLVRAKWTAHQRGDRDFADLLWAVLVFELWLDEARRAGTPPNSSGGC